MTLLEIRRAPRVCAACKARKKACDKQLPACGRCARRGLTCRYDTLTGTGPVEMDSPWTVYTAPDVNVARYNPCVASTVWSPPPHQSNLLFRSPSSTDRTSLDNMLEQRIHRLLLHSSLSVDVITERYFRSVHKYLPVVSPYLLDAATSQFKRATPRADFSLLLLCMGLLVVRPSVATTQVDESTSIELLYRTVKTIFGHVQAVICASTSLVQAALLICAYEYVSGQDAAYITIGTCARMAHTLGINCDPTQRLGLLNDVSSLRLLEQWNVWWAVVILERLILSEPAFRSQLPSTQFPDQASHLPSDLVFEGPLSPISDTHLPRPMPILSAVDADNVSSFGRQAQASHLLDHVLRSITSPSCRESLIPHMRALDRDLQGFISIAIAESHRIHCSAYTTAVKSFFIVHETILETTTAGEIDERSRAALETATRIMSCVAQDHLDNASVECLPLCCASNLRVGIRHMVERSSCDGLQSCLALEARFCGRWGADGRGL
ncbi:hypothetical protein V1509DRAFT_201313 [Lipomyces kononenkoae]